MYYFRLYEKLLEDDQAAAAFTEYISETEKQGVIYIHDTPFPLILWQSSLYLIMNTALIAGINEFMNEATWH